MDSAQAKILSESLIGQHIGEWYVSDYLGAGKSAVVMRAERQGERAAVKVFHPELVEWFGEATQLKRIEREKLLIGSKRPSLVQILDGGKCPNTGHLFVVMEFIPYKNLREVLHLVPPNSYRGIVAQLASAAMFLEEKGLAHRDIKPENIALSDDYTTVKLLDLGVLRPFGVSELTDKNGISISEQAELFEDGRKITLGKKRMIDASADISNIGQSRDLAAERCAQLVELIAEALSEGRLDLSALKRPLGAKPSLRTVKAMPSPGRGRPMSIMSSHTVGKNGPRHGVDHFHASHASACRNIPRAHTSAAQP